MRSLVLSLLMTTSFLGGKQAVIKSRFNYEMSLYYESNVSSGYHSSMAFINGKRLSCICGNDPILIMIVYGHVQGFCSNHIPYVDTVIGKDCKCKEQV